MRNETLLQNLETNRLKVSDREKYTLFSIGIYETYAKDCLLSQKVHTDCIIVENKNQYNGYFKS